MISFLTLVCHTKIWRVGFRTFSGWREGPIVWAFEEGGIPYFWILLTSFFYIFFQGGSCFILPLFPLCTSMICWLFWHLRNWKTIVKVTEKNVAINVGSNFVWISSTVRLILQWNGNDRLNNEQNFWWKKIKKIRMAFKILFSKSLKLFWRK